jgi:hypothetical protein
MRADTKCQVLSAKPDGKSNPPHWRFVRSDLSALCREERFGNDFLPDDDDGRAMLTAFLCIGESDVVAIKFAPWCEAELPALKRRARCTKWANIGKLIRITTKEIEEYIGLPIDKTAEEFEAWKKDRSKRMAKERQQQCRERLKEEKERKLARAKAEPNPRHAAIHKMVTDPWSSVSVPEIMRKVSKSKAFQRSSRSYVTYVGGPPPSAIVKNLRDAVHETLNQLEAKGIVVTARRPGKRGPVRWVRLAQNAEIGASEPQNGSVGASDPLLDGKCSEVNGLIENNPCHAAYRTWERDAVFDTQSAEQKTLAGSDLDPDSKIMKEAA